MTCRLADAAGQCSRAHATNSVFDGAERVLGRIAATQLIVGTALGAAAFAQEAGKAGGAIKLGDHPARTMLIAEGLPQVKPMLPAGAPDGAAFPADPQ